MMLNTMIGLIAGVLVGAVAAFFIYRAVAHRSAQSIESEARDLLVKAKKEAETLARGAELDAKDIKIRAHAELEEELKVQRLELKRLEEKHASREELLDRKRDLITSKENEIQKREQDQNKREERIQKRDKEVSQSAEKIQSKLEEVAQLSRDEAKRRIIEQVTDEAKRESALELKRIEDQAREEAEARAKRIIGVAVQRYAGEHVQERAVSVVSLPSDEMKGRIIGREGRNIRALEAATGMELIIDDTPETVVISGFDPIRREVARLTLEKLIQDGRIHPTRIEELVAKSQAEVDKTIKEAGEQAILELGIARVHPEIVKMLGRLKYRYSYAQNVLRHSVEAGFIAGLMAAELGENVKKARRAGLFHDLGKAMSHEVEGSHAIVGAQFARKHGEEPIVVNAIASHHEEEQPQTVLAHLVAAADALSGARPGARREMLESYVKRLEDLERICGSFQGVDKSYAIQAGREVRVMVESERISDADAVLLVKDITKRIEEELTYPGQIKVTVIRETRATGYAK